jgi:predicted TIM-barrel fold metal-dependent hydrolase
MNPTAPHPDRLPRLSPPAEALPAGACDAHVHVFDPQAFAYQAIRSYTPGAAPVAALQAMHARAGIGRCVLVQPSVYGTDNRCLLDALKALGAERARGVAVVDLARASPASLPPLHAAGVRGVRINLKVKGETSLVAARAALRGAERLAEMPGWSLHLHAELALIAALADELDRLQVPVVLDHYAGAKADTDATRLEPLLALLRRGRSYVKLSASYRVSAFGPPHADLRQITLQLLAAAPGQLLWGSDWPHTAGAASRGNSIETTEPFRDEDAGLALETLHSWLGETAWHCLWVDNPARLYGFAPLPRSPSTNQSPWRTSP